MRFIDPQDFATMPWKNGGGNTHEIARHERDGQVSWRLSVADVESDGPFSAFPGLRRILTVFEGKGLKLAGPDQPLEALPFVPVAFAGDLAIHSTRIDGKVRDFNLMFDPLQWTGAVTVLDHPERIVLNADMLALLLPDGGYVNGEAVGHGGCAVCSGETATVSAAGRVLAVRLHAKT